MQHGLQLWDKSAVLPGANRYERYLSFSYDNLCRSWAKQRIHMRGKVTSPCHLYQTGASKTTFLFFTVCFQSSGLSWVSSVHVLLQLNQHLVFFPTDDRSEINPIGCCIQNQVDYGKINSQHKLIWFAMINSLKAASSTFLKLSLREKQTQTYIWF